MRNGEKATPKQWKAEYDSIGKEKSKTATELAYAEAISYNRKNPTYLIEVHGGERSTQSMEDRLRRVILYGLEQGKQGKTGKNDGK